MRIDSWEVNSVRQPLTPLPPFLKETALDFSCFQELKCDDAAFPHLEVEDAGYDVGLHGQKAFNGVAILSRHRIEHLIIGLPGFDGAVQSRYLEAVISNGERVARRFQLRPQRQSADTPKNPYKLAFMAALTRHAAALCCGSEPFDARDPAAWAGDALFLPQSRAAYQRLLNIGCADALRAVTDDAGLYTFWGYQAGAWEKNRGIRIERLLLSPQVAVRLRGVEIAKAMPTCKSHRTMRRSTPISLDQASAPIARQIT